jgi:hypothetical protein
MRKNVTKVFRKLHSEKFHNFYSSPNVIKRTGGWACSTHGIDEKYI